MGTQIVIMVRRQISVFGLILNRNFGRNRKMKWYRNRNRNAYRNRNFGRNRNWNRNFLITSMKCQNCFFFTWVWIRNCFSASAKLFFSFSISASFSFNSFFQSTFSSSMTKLAGWASSTNSGFPEEKRKHYFRSRKKKQNMTLVQEKLIILLSVDSKQADLKCCYKKIMSFRKIV